MAIKRYRMDAHRPFFEGGNCFGDPVASPKEDEGGGWVKFRTHDRVVSRLEAKVRRLEKRLAKLEC